MDKKNRQESFIQIATVAAIPFVLAAPPLLGWFLGSLLDDLLNTVPYLTALFILLGIIGSTKELFRIIKGLQSER